MPEFIDDGKLDQMMADIMAPVAGKPTASLVVVNTQTDTDSIGSMVVDDVGVPTARKTVLVGREIGTGKVCKITIEYPEEEKSNG